MTDYWPDSRRGTGHAAAGRLALSGRTQCVRSV